VRPILKLASPVALQYVSCTKGNACVNAKESHEDHFLYLDYNGEPFIAKADVLESQREILTRRFLRTLFYMSHLAYIIYYQKSNIQKLSVVCTTQRTLNIISRGLKNLGNHSPTLCN